MSLIDNVRVSAYNQQPEPDENWKMPEIVLWYAFRELYRDFREGKLKEEDGKTRKAKILKQYQVQKTEYETMNRIVLHQAEMWRGIEIAGDRYCTDRTLENADAFIEAVYGVRIKRDSTEASEPEE